MRLISDNSGLNDHLKFLTHGPKYERSTRLDEYREGLRPFNRIDFAAQRAGITVKSEEWLEEVRAMERDRKDSQYTHGD